MGKTIREAYGEALAEIGCKNQNVVVFDADVSGSTRTDFFANACPERFFNVGIQEANMVGMAAGMASVGKIPFINTFAVFLTTIGLLPARAFASYSNLNMKFVGAYGGMSDAYDGPSHHALEDIAVMRTLPRLKVFVPSDNVQTKWLVQHAAATPGPMYLRLSRAAFPDIYEEYEQFQEGKGKLVRSGEDVTVIACGLLVGHALKVAEDLAKEGLSVRVVDMFCIKPLDTALVIQCAQETGAIVSAEEHSIYGGLGGAVAETLCGEGVQVPMAFVGVNDCHGECGEYDKLQGKYGFDTEALKQQVWNVVRKKRAICG